MSLSRGDFLPLRTRPNTEVLDSVEQHMRWACAATCVEMRRGLANLASVVTTAPLIGLLGTVIGIFDAFKGCGSQKWACFAAIMDGLCKALITTTLGLLVAIPAAWFYNYLTDRMEIFNIEMQLASSEVLNYLAIHQRTQFSQFPPDG